MIPESIAAVGEQLLPSAEVDRALRFHMETFRPKPGEKAMDPHLAVETLEDDNKPGMALIPVLEDAFWNSHEARKRFVRRVGQEFAERNLKPIVIYLVTECWTKALEKGQEPPKGSLRLQEVKQESIVASALTIDGRAALAMAKILRDEEARISGYGEIDLIACGSRQENGEPAVEAKLLEAFFIGYSQTLFGKLKHAQGAVPDS